MVKLALKDWPRRPLVVAPRVHVDVHTARATNRTIEGVTVYDQDKEEGNECTSTH